ncbi:hypothetical protein B0I27_10965 [Arcticibacter pallidicorallinus]|uniref:Uncharacterized protein n=1 Tax=Arcticibacter pallidicorallinus TaxID=1259464 RepID=A0A2T0TXG6_9SPHI|nr:hypothetical protein [Arcticibacter pallidicorallinus]PRY50343.1 hypothetical protein B0I27_10965 [Arcticibacter pallidicorallinus]
MMNLSHNRIWKGIFLMLFAMFSLSPCSAKQSVLQTFDLEFGRNANKTKATGNMINGCSIVKHSRGKALVNPSVIKLLPHHQSDHDTVERSESAVIGILVNNSVGIKTAGRLPQYILFKRFKVHLA